MLLNSGGADVDQEHLCLACQFLVGNELPISRSPLAFALDTGDLSTARALLDRGATASAVMADEWTALHSATQSGLVEGLELLLQNPSYGVDVHARDVSDRTAYMIVVQMNAQAVLQRLVHYGATEELDLFVDMPDQLERGQEVVLQVGLCLSRLVFTTVSFFFLVSVFIPLCA
ncbi:hypothetical protein DFH09DRAFT_1313740 [Mycena vulgaris]|nr:hypothetical protein DFH09DRAFT_1313740 [Mycena vulgaris]